MKNRAIVLLSGGLDSTTCLGHAIKSGFDPVCLSFSYGQLHTGEIQAAKEIAAFFNVKDHIIIELPKAVFGSSALTGNGVIPMDREDIDEKGVPSTYVPARNTIFLSYALAYCESLDIRDIFIGVSSVDYSGYPDCRPQFIEAFENLANNATKIALEGGKINIHAPLLHLTKGKTIKLGISCGVDYSLTHTCYSPDENMLACGRCDSCVLRRKGFEEAGVADPTKYQEKK
ncbi:7-cyano-7-deazaguanine synthase QueC [Myxococcota bacterium]|nr:7-cyano-7-deazaguanine synthase QueC [Myxococcota bacterium]MBU1379402.1 7-cyano-7-deazaguanine synthase QueC [Myxococcota bacterium]MBU1496804.1 7-cyano-7-deazaguanine synthase QueC [Myxococcota bacterium]